MNDAGEYIFSIRQMILLHPHVQHFQVVREEDQGSSGLLRYRLTLIDGGLLEISERFRIVDGKAQSLKYRFHWQDRNEQLVARWDTAPHHPALPTFPHHIHDGMEENILPHAPVRVADVLRLVADRFRETK